MKIKIKIFIFSVLILNSILINAQVKDENKKEEEIGIKKEEIILTGIVEMQDSVLIAELVKRADNWMKLPAKLYLKTDLKSSAKKSECFASFNVKPKGLNPEVDYTGKIKMKLSVDFKDNKYKYTINEITHTSKIHNTSGGSLDRKIPECGSVHMNLIVWNKLKGEAKSYAAQVVEDLKAGMLIDSANSKKDDW